MAETIVRNLAELQQVYRGLMQDFLSISYEGTLTGLLGDLESIHAGYFASGAGPEGAWPPLAPSTIARKGHDRILIDKGDLMASLTGSHGDAIREIVVEGDNQGLSFGTSRPYSVYHQFGASRLPVREHVGIRDEHAAQFGHQIADDTMAALKAAAA